MSANVHISQDATFDADIATGVVLVDFWAEWCGPCKVMVEQLDRLAEKIGESAKIMKMDVDANPQTPQKFRIMSIPTLIIFKDGQPVEKFVGVKTAEDLHTALLKYV